MIPLILGLVIFLGVHAFTMQRDQRAAVIGRLGEGPYKGLYTLVSLAGFALIVWGFGAYRSSGYIPVWDPPVWTRHLALLLNLPVFILFVAAYAPGRIKALAKHPMLLAVKIWATAHLLANGDLGSILLFGAFLAWAVAARIAAKRRGADPAPLPPGTGALTRGDIIAIGAGLALYLVMVVWLHPLLIGVPVLPGR
jgi:uncharacterized membrane protein